MTGLAHKVRCSSLPRIFACPASGSQPEFNINSHNIFAELGIKTHGIGSEALLTGAWIINEGMPTEQRIMAFKMKSMWLKLREWITPLAVEHTMEFNNLSGSPDIIGRMEGDCLVIVDWKTGYKEDDYSHQLMGYAYLAVHSSEFPWVKSIRLVTAWVRSGITDIVDVSLDDLGVWWNRLCNLSVTQYRPGEQCVYCPLEMTCKAKQAYTTNIIASLSPLADPIPDMTKETAFRIYSSIGLIEKVLKQAKDLVKAEALKGPVPIGFQSFAEYVVDEKREIVFNADTMKHLNDAGLDDNEIMEIVGVSIKDLEEAVKKKAPRGEKGTRVQKLMEALDSAKLIQKKESRRLVVRKEPAALIEVKSNV